MNFRKLNLQLFAADTGAGGNSQGVDTSANTVQNSNDGDNQNSNADGNTKTYTQDDIAKLKEDWAKEQESSYQSKLKDGIAKAIEEEKRLSKLSKDEKDAEEKQKLLSRIESLEKEKELGILKEKALNALSEQKLPNSFLNFVIGANEKATLDNISAIKSAFDSAVQAQVEERLKGKTPNISNTGGKSDDIAEQFANALRGKF
nr:MAG TPA: Major head protein [Caudoviricetes sp.]